MYTNNKCAVKIGKKHTDFFQQSRGVRQGCSSSPTLFNINQLARTLEQSAAPGITLVDTEIKCLLFADDLVLLSPTKEGLQHYLDLLQSFSQTWALTVNLSKTKVIIFEIRPSLNKYTFHLDTVTLEQGSSTFSTPRTPNLMETWSGDPLLIYWIKWCFILNWSYSAMDETRN